MIWVLLGLLLFGGSAGDFGRPHARVLAIQANAGAVVRDDDRRDAAQAIADRMLAEVESTKAIAQELGRRLRALDEAPKLDAAAYRQALDAALNAVDASERRLLALRIELRGALTAEEWVELMQPLREGG